MNTGQVMLVLGAMALLGTLALTLNRVMLDKTTDSLDAEGMITATAIGQAMIEEITAKRYDQNLAPPAYTDSVGSLVAYYFLGTDAGEIRLQTDTIWTRVSAGRVIMNTISTPSSNTFNDIDDYSGYSRTYVTPRLGAFVATTTVYYVADNSPDVVSHSKSFIKRVDVRVQNLHISSPDSSLSLSKIISYRYRR